jgi:hypothetical protein
MYGVLKGILLAIRSKAKLARGAGELSLKSCSHRPYGFFINCDLH